MANFFGIMLTVLVTGAFWGTWFTLTRPIENFTPGEFINIGQTIIANVAVPMRILMPLAVVVKLLVIFRVRKKQRTALTFYLNF